jgi:RecB family exonuclease
VREHGLTLHLYDDASALWQDIWDQWRADPQSRLYFPSPLSRDHFLRQKADQGTIWSGQTDTILSLWRQAGQALDQRGADFLPRRLTTQLAQSLLRQLLQQAGPPLDQLVDSSSGIQALLLHLEQIERQADRDYATAAQTAIECAVQDLRQRLCEQQWAVMAGYRSYIARQAYDVHLQHQALITPLPDLSPHLGGLLRGLACHNRISAWFLTNRASADMLLERVNLTEMTIQQHFNGQHPAAQLFADRHQRRERLTPAVDRQIPAYVRPELNWVIAEDELEAALDQLQTWQAAGHSLARVGVIMPQPALSVAALAELASERHLPLVIRPTLRAPDTSLGTLLRQLASTTLDDQHLLIDSDTEYPLDSLRIEQLQTARTRGGLSELQALQQLGKTLLDERSATLPYPSDFNLSHLWLEALERTYRELLAQPQLHNQIDCLDVIESVEGPRQLLGDTDGAIVLSYREAASYCFHRVVLLGLSAGVYPPALTRSPFVSPALLKRIPRLQEAVPEAEFVAAFASGTQAVVCIQQSADLSDNGSAFWQASRRLVKATNSIPDASDAAIVLQSKGHGQSLQRRWQHAARHRLDHQQLLSSALQRAQRTALPQGYFAGTRSAFSITELETYLSCPRGWFVRYVLQVRSTTNAQAERGTIVHNILAVLFAAVTVGSDQQLLAQRLDQIPILVQRYGGRLTRFSRDQMTDQLERLLRAYSAPVWPLRQHYTEVSVQTTGILPNFPDYQLRGRVDRIDSDEREFLVIDYKSKWSYQTPQSTLQPFLYPLMAQRQGPVSGQHPLGAIYLSLFYTQHRGWLSSVNRYQQIDNGQLRDDWSNQADAACQRAEAAISQIEHGHWAEKGSNCASWCPHHLLAETVAERSGQPFRVVKAQLLDLDKEGDDDRH